MAWCKYYNQKCNYCGDCNVKGNEESIYNGKSRQYFKKMEKEKYSNKKVDIKEQQNDTSTFGNYNCPNCKYNADDCINKNCTTCLISREGRCLCLDEAADEELESGNCKYFEQK